MTARRTSYQTKIPAKSMDAKAPVSPFSKFFTLNAKKESNEQRRFLPEN